jgi:hypothetical protein
MAVLIDFSQVTISALQKQMNPKYLGVVADKDLCRHLVLNSIRNVVHKFKRDYGKIIICCDSRKYWRTEIFPHYKGSRKKNRDASGVDWELIFEVLDEVKADMKTTFPYQVIEVERAEADDIIGTLTPRLSSHEPVILVSADGDFKQLHQYKNVKQYNPTLGAFVTSPNPHQELKEKIIRGDSGDGITNIISPSDSLIMGIRQKSITKPILEKYMALNFDDSNIENYSVIQRNKTLIDLSMIPVDIKSAIIREYETEQEGNKVLVMKYLMKHKLNMLLECVDEF